MTPQRIRAITPHKQAWSWLEKSTRGVPGVQQSLYVVFHQKTLQVLFDHEIYVKTPRLFLAVKYIAPGGGQPLENDRLCFVRQHN